jgi:hypothetical protein
LSEATPCSSLTSFSLLGPQLPSLHSSLPSKQGFSSLDLHQQSDLSLVYDARLRFRQGTPPSSLPFLFFLVSYFPLSTVLPARLRPRQARVDQQLPWQTCAGRPVRFPVFFPELLCSTSPRTEPARSTKASSSCASSYRITSGGAYRAPALSLLKCSDPNRAFSSSLFPPLPHLFSPCFPPDPPTLHPVPRRLTVTTARITSVKESVTTPRRNKLELTTRRKSGRSVSNATFVKDG